MYKNVVSWQDVVVDPKKDIDAGLHSKLSEYAKIPKCDLVTRRDFLNNIVSSSGAGVPSSILKSLNMRIEYFNRIIQMYDTGILYPDYNPQVYDESRVISLLKPKKNVKNLIYPNNKVFYGKQKKDVWGDAYLDILDPAHRNLVFWKQQWLNSSSCQPFFTALEEFVLPPDMPCVLFYDDTEIEKRKAVISDNKILVGGKPVNSPKVDGVSNQTMFIINENNELIIDFSSTRIRHISLSCGKPVLGGGLMVVKDGRLQEISNSSGHYLFSVQDFAQTLRLLRKHGICFSPDTMIEHWYAFAKNERLPFSVFCAKYKIDM